MQGRLWEEDRSLESDRPGRQSESGGDPGPSVGLPAAAGDLPDELMCMWEVDLGDTGMAVIFRAGEEK